MGLLQFCCCSRSRAGSGRTRRPAPTADHPGIEGASLRRGPLILCSPGSRSSWNADPSSAAAAAHGAMSWLPDPGNLSLCLLPFLLLSATQVAAAAAAAGGTGGPGIHEHRQQQQPRLRRRWRRMPSASSWLRWVLLAGRPDDLRSRGTPSAPGPQRAEDKKRLVICGGAPEGAITTAVSCFCCCCCCCIPATSNPAVVPPLAAANPPRALGLRRVAIEGRLTLVAAGALPGRSPAANARGRWKEDRSGTRREHHHPR